VATRFLSLSLLALIPVLQLTAQTDLGAIIQGTLGKVTRSRAVVGEIQLRTVPAEPKIRPFEHLVVQVQALGEVDGRKGRIDRDGAVLRLRNPGTGWISKPFRFQEQEEVQFIDRMGTNQATIFGRIGEYVTKDSFLYTAPYEPGKYVLEAELDGRRATLEIEVSEEAETRIKEPETVSFWPEYESQDPYRALVEHWAPMFAQETWFVPKGDYFARFDFDEDWQGDNNWENLWKGSSQAYVYYAVMETDTHWFLIYNAFHVRDYSDICQAGSCHENDNEGVILTVKKDFNEFGTLQALESLAHNNIYSATADPRLRNGVHDIDGPVEFYEGSHPVVYVESGGHGIYPSRTKHSRYMLDRDEFLEGTGVTYVYKGVAERPKHPNDRLVGYELLPIKEHWWDKLSDLRAHNAERMYDDFFAYAPFGDRPMTPFDRIPSAFLGRTEAANKARPFWGWFDSATKKAGVLNDGQWGLDPAYAVSRNLTFPADEEFSLDYIYNPYLGIDETHNWLGGR
jgi:hypothetical protein